MVLIAHEAVATFDVAENPLLNKTLLLYNECMKWDGFTHHINQTFSIVFYLEKLFIVS